jgi:hypothetical protein
MHLAKSIPAALLALAVTGLVGCDWSSNSTSLNTSQGAGVNINFSGVYDGNLAGGKAVDKPTKGNILRLVISQSGNRVEVVDNQGSRYEGTVGSPGVVSQPDSSSGRIPSARNWYRRRSASAAKMKCPSATSSSWGSFTRSRWKTLMEKQNFHLHGHGWHEQLRVGNYTITPRPLRPLLQCRQRSYHHDDGSWV